MWPQKFIYVTCQIGEYHLYDWYLNLLEQFEPAKDDCNTHESACPQCELLVWVNITFHQVVSIETSENEDWSNEHWDVGQPVKRVPGIFTVPGFGIPNHLWVRELERHVAVLNASKLSADDDHKLLIRKAMVSRWFNSFYFVPLHSAKIFMHTSAWFWRYSFSSVSLSGTYCKSLSICFDLHSTYLLWVVWLWYRSLNSSISWKQRMIISQMTAELFCVQLHVHLF